MQTENEIDKICAQCSVGKNSDECMRILKGLVDEECLLQKVVALKNAAIASEVGDVEKYIAEEMAKAGYKYVYRRLK